ncbi:MAG: glutathione S-transferase domain-containing protein [Pseudomonadota bacterium]
MISSRKLVHTIFLLSLPIIVAAFGLSWLTALLLVLVALLWRWALAFIGLTKPEHKDAVVLESISGSHFVEKVRWSLDRLGVEYVERASGGILGVLFFGRTVPRLNFRSGMVRSSIGNSAEILRFLWGHYGVREPQRAAFLQPTADAIDLEKRLDRYGAHLQVWGYYHMLPVPELSVRFWGVDDPHVPWWQRMLLRPFYPLYAGFLKRAFRIDEKGYQRARQQIDELLADLETQLADGRANLFATDEPTFVDITFAALSGLWLTPANHGGGRAGSCMVARNRLPGGMQEDIERWIEDHPRATALVNRLYAEERIA